MILLAAADVEVPIGVGLLAVGFVITAVWTLYGRTVKQDDERFDKHVEESDGKHKALSARIDAENAERRSRDHDLAADIQSDRLKHASLEARIAALERAQS